MKNRLSIIALVFAIVSFLVCLLWPDYETIKIVTKLTLVLAISAFIIAIIGKRQIKKKQETGKIFAILGIILGLLTIFLASFRLFVLNKIKDTSFNDTYICSNKNLVTNCKDNQDGTSICTYRNTDLDIVCTTKNIKK